MYVWLSVLFYWLIQQGVDATLTPSGPTVSVDCGGQQTFTCTVNAAGAAWTITGLNGITETASNGIAVAGNNRVTTTDSSGLVQASTITITGFTPADDGGTVQCINLAESNMVQGMTTVSVESTTLASATAVMANGDQCITANLTWIEPSDSNATTSVSCTPSSPQCSSCTSSGCSIGELTPSTLYTFSVTRGRSGCDDSTAVSSAVMSGGIPECGTVEASTDSCPTITFTPGTTKPSTVLVSFNGPSQVPTLTCSYSAESGIMCPMTDIVPIGTYDVSFTPQNNCGSPQSACPIQAATFSDNNCIVTITSPSKSDTGDFGLTSSALGGIIAAGIIVIIVSGAVGYPLVLLILACTCYSSIGFCGLLKCKCFNGKARRSSSKQRIDSASPVTPPAQPPAQAPSDEYADPQAIRNRKERGKEDKDKIQYAAIDFSVGAGSGAGEVKIHQKEEPVIYTTVQHV